MPGTVVLACIAVCIFGLQDTGKSRYFVITKFNHCFIIRSLSWFFFYEYPLEAKRFAISMSDRKKEKSMVSLTHEKSNLLFAAKQLVR